MKYILYFWWLWLSVATVGAGLMIADAARVLLCGKYHSSRLTLAGFVLLWAGMLPMSLILWRWFILFVIG